MVAEVGLVLVMGVVGFAIVFKLAEMRIADRMQPPHLVRVDEPASDLVYSTLNGKTEHLAAAKGQVVFLNLSGLPIEATCTFVYPSIPAGGGTTALLLGTTAPHSCGTTQPYFLGERGGGPGLGTLAVPALAGLVAVFVPGRRRWLRGLMAIALATAAMQLSGCGNCTDLGTRPGTYTIQVIGASAGTSEVESQIVTVTVTI
jgi:hypothetical protein